MSEQKEERHVVVKTLDADSTQARETVNAATTIEPKYPFQTLIDTYYNSFSVAGLTDTLASSINSWFETDSDDLRALLERIDHKFLLANYLAAGNAFFEVIRDRAGRVSRLVPVVAETIKMLSGWKGFVQTVGVDKVYFNSFMPTATEQQRAEKARQIEIFNASSWTATSLVPWPNGAWFNENLNEIYHFKNISLDSIYYWNSFFEPVFTQAALLANIDKYYQQAFDNGLIKSKILFWTTEGKMTRAQMEALGNMLKSKNKGVKNAFSSAVIDMPIWQLDLEHEIDANAFMNYRTQLLQSIALALNIPFDLVNPENSNRATSQVSLEQFNRFTVKPLQNRLLNDFRLLFAENFPNEVEALKYVEIDTKDQKEEMEVLTGYVNGWILTPDEARETLGYNPVAGIWWELRTQSTQRVIENSVKKSTMDFLTNAENESKIFEEEYGKQFDGGNIDSQE